MPAQLEAQRRDTTKKVRPPAETLASPSIPACCKVVGADSATRTVTARETATGYAFRFRVSEPRQFGSVEIGDPVWADFAARTVRLDAGDPDPCCTILPAPPATPPRKAPRLSPDDVLAAPLVRPTTGSVHSCIR
jgi:hypothetical protein